MQIILRKGRESDIKSVEKLYADARKRLASAGIDQWQGEYPQGSDFLNDIKEGRAVICEYNGNIVASAAAYIGKEKTYSDIYFGKWKTDFEIYGIVHRAAVSQNFLRMGAAEAIFEYTEKLCRENGTGSIRCDTHRDNLPMNSLLVKNGFLKCGTIFVSDGTERTAYEKIIEK